MNRHLLPPAATGLILQIFVLASILALREAYSGKLPWQFVLLLTCPLLFFFILKNHQQRRQNRDVDKK